MPRYQFEETTRVTLVNPPFQDRNLDSREITCALVVHSEDYIDPGPYREALRGSLTRLKNAIVVAVDDPYMLKLLEPKTGNTVHNFLTRLSDTLATGAHRYTRLGNTVPSDTINGYVVYVLPATRKPSLEALAAIVIEDMATAGAAEFDLTVNDGRLAYTVSSIIPSYLTL